MRKIVLSLLLCTLCVFANLKAQESTMSIIASDDITVRPGYAEDWSTYPFLNVKNGGDKRADGTGNGYTNPFARTVFLKFDLSSLPSDTEATIDSVRFAITTTSNPDRVVKNYIADVPVVQGYSDGWDETTMIYDLAVIYWSYGVGLDGEKLYWLREAINDTTMIDYFEVGPGDSLVTKYVNVTEAVQNDEDGYLTLALYDRDRDPDWFTSSTTVNENVSLQYISKDDDSRADEQKPSLVVYTSAPSGISKTYASNSFSVYPNPANSYITLKLQNHSSGKYMITDIAGKLLMSAVIRSQRQVIDIEKLNPGYYFITMDYGNLKETKKFIVK